MLKNSFLFTLALFLLLTNLKLAGQNQQERIAVNKQFHKVKLIGTTEYKRDTTRTFSIQSANVDQRIDNLIALLGEPSYNDYRFKWSNVIIKGIDTPLTIELYDGIVSKENGLYKKTPFRSSEDKTNKLNSLKDNSGRDAELEFLTEGDVNIVKDKATEILIKNYLKEVMF